MFWKIVERTAWVLGSIFGGLTLYFTAGLYYGWNVPVTPIAAPRPQPGATMTLPVWSLLVFGLVGVLLLITAWVMMFIRQRGASSASELEPDWKIRDFFLWLDPGIAEKTSSEWDQIAAPVIDRLSLGQIKAWGRERNKGSSMSKYLPLTVIDHTYWKNASFSFVFLLDGQELDQHVTLVRGTKDLDYGDLRVNKAQAQSRFATWAA